jgi:hypothetical protein
VLAVYGRWLRTTVAVVCAAWIGVLALYAAEPIADALRWALGLFDPRDLVAWCVVLGTSAALFAFLHNDPRSARLLARAAAILAPVRRLPARVAAVPAGVSLPLVVAAAFSARVALDRGASIPRVFGDELIYSGIAKALATGSGLELRGADIGLSYGPLYPLVLSPVYRFAEDGAAAFLGVQTLNALLMSMTAVPAYYLARRVVTPGWSLAVAALSVAVPAMAYSSLVMTEALFYPGFVAACLVLALTLERPTRFRQALLVASVLALAGVRVQALVLVPAFVTAVLAEGLRRRQAIAEVGRRFATAWLLLGLAGVIALAAHGGDIKGPLGAYGALVRGYSPVDTVEWLAWNVAAFDFSLGFVALGGFLVSTSLMLKRSASERDGAFAAASVGIVCWTAISVALLSASPYGLDHLHWRSLFIVVPLVLTGFAWWLAAGLPRPGLPTLLAAAAVFTLPLVLPWRLVLTEHPVDTPATLVWMSLGELAPSLASTRVVVPFAALGVAVLLLARSAFLPLVSVVLAFAAVLVAADFQAPVSRGRVEGFAWVDRALPDDAEALLLHVDIPRYCPQIEYASRQRDLEVMTEFFNTSITRVRNIWGQIVHDGLSSRQITFGADGSLRDEGELVPVRFLVADTRLDFVGDRIARLDVGSIGMAWQPPPTGSLTLWRVQEPARLADPRQIHGERLFRLACRAPDSTVT